MDTNSSKAGAIAEKQRLERAKEQDKEQTRDPAKEGGTHHRDAEKTTLSPAAPGDDRTPADTIGEIAYAVGEKKETGGAGQRETSKLEPEKQGGIGGP
jgi:hypothetical protein